MTSVDRMLDLDGVALRQASFRFEVVDPDGAQIGEAHPLVPCNVDNNTTRAIVRSLGGFQLDASETAAVNPFSDRMRPVMDIGGASYPLGLFLFADANRVVRSWGDETDGTLVDQGLIVDQSVTRTIGYSKGYSVDTALAELVAISQLGILASIENVGTTFGSSVVWPIGTSLLTIINAVAAIGGLLPLFFANDGTPTLMRAPDPQDATDPLVYAAGGRIYDGSIVVSDDLLTAPNRWIVVDTAPTSAPIVGVYDLPPTAPNSYANRGFYITDPFDMQGLGSVAAAEAAAKARAQQSPPLTTVTFEGPPDPRHDTHDVVEFLGTRYRELSWSMPLVDGAPMKHELREAA